MKWFMPPMPAPQSHRQVAMHEPSVVVMTMSLPYTKYSPGNTFTASLLKCES